jgi:hypothetical protein
MIYSFDATTILLIFFLKIEQNSVDKRNYFNLAPFLMPPQFMHRYKNNKIKELPKQRVNRLKM